MVEKTFVVGTGRCGTRYCAELLKANGVDTVWEPQKLLHPAMAAYHFGELDDQRVRLLRDEVGAIDYPNRDVVVDNGLTFCLDLIKDIYPDANIVHLHRDGPPTITSHVRNGGDVNWHHRWGVLRRRANDHWDIFNAACHWWTTKNDIIIEATQSDDVDSMRLSFDDLIDGDLSELESFIGADLDVRRIEPQNTTSEDRKNNFPSPEDWTTYMKNIYNVICGPTAVGLGYSHMETG